MDEPIQASKVVPENVEWLWPIGDELAGRVPRKMLTIVGGRPDQRKGLWVTRVASDISNARFPVKGSKETRPGKVLYSAIEDSHSLMTRPRLEAAGANLENIDLWRFRLPLHFIELADRLAQHGPYDLLVMDPFASHLSTGVSRHSDNVRTVTDPLIALLELTGTACAIVEHVLKRVPKSGHPIAAIGGTGSGLIAAARMGFLFGTDPENEDRSFLCCVKHNICAKPDEMAFDLETVVVKGVRDEMPALTFDEECEFDPMLFLQAKPKGGRTGRPPGKREAASEWLAEYLYAALRQGLPPVGDGKPIAPGPVPAARVLEDALQFAFADKTVRRAAKDLLVVKEPPSGPHTKWGLASDVVEIMDAAYGYSETPDGELEASKDAGDVAAGVQEVFGAGAVAEEVRPLPSERAGMVDMTEFEKALKGEGEDG